MTDNSKKIEKIKHGIESLDKQIHAKRHSGTSQQNMTPRRKGILEQQHRDADALEKRRNILAGVVKYIKNETLPECLAKISSQKHVSDILFARDFNTSKVQDALKRAGVNNQDELDKVKGHFEAILRVNPVTVDPAAEVKKMEANLLGTKIPGFFPTPKEVSRTMAERLDIKPGMVVLDPSAGKGDLLEVVKEVEHSALVQGVEICHTLVEITKAKGLNVEAGDFLDGIKVTPPDRIIMNPPFEKMADIDHVQKAYEVLKPGGKMVTIISPAPFQREQKKPQAFREWLSELDHEVENLPANSFTGKDSFRQTSVATKLLIINKPE
jgi:16S rRNA G1207 methylase RsmC